jgi:hypothetical protein
VQEKQRDIAATAAAAEAATAALEERQHHLWPCLEETLEELHVGVGYPAFRWRVSLLVVCLFFALL